MCHTYNELGETRNNGRSRTAKSEIILILGKKKDYRYMEILEADTIKQLQIKKKLEKNTSEGRESFLIKALKQKSHQMDKYVVHSLSIQTFRTGI